MENTRKHYNRSTIFTISREDGKLESFTIDSIFRSQSNDPGYYEDAKSLKENVNFIKENPDAAMTEEEYQAFMKELADLDKYKWIFYRCGKDYYYESRNFSIFDTKAYIEVSITESTENEDPKLPKTSSSYIRPQSLEAKFKTITEFIEDAFINPAKIRENDINYILYGSDKFKDITDEELVDEIHRRRLQLY